MPAKVYLPAPRKYRNQPTKVDGIRFASKKEADRYKELRFLKSSCAIFDLEIQPRYVLTVNGMSVGAYVGDFKYFTSALNAVIDANPVIEDVKGVKTAVYKLKKKLMKAIYGIEIQEV